MTPGELIEIAAKAIDPEAFKELPTSMPILRRRNEARATAARVLVIFEANRNGILGDAQHADAFAA